MMSKKKALRTGINACVKKIGYEYCKENWEKSCVTYGMSDRKKFYCFLGVSDEEDEDEKDYIPMLTPGNDWPMSARCYVDMKTGVVSDMVLMRYGEECVE